MVGVAFAIEEEAYFSHQGRQLHGVGYVHRVMPYDGVERMMGDFMAQTDCAERNNWGWWTSNSLVDCGLADGLTYRRQVASHGHSHGVVAVPRIASSTYVGVRPTTIFDGNYNREF